MRAVGQRGTGPERSVRQLVRRLGHHYRINNRNLPGSPDLSNRTQGWAVFVHGCFWHGHRNCAKTKGGRSGRIPVTNRGFWREKIDANRERDARKAAQLRGIGLRVCIVWECELRNELALTRKLRRFLR